MKKIILLCLLFPCIFTSANELTEDYFDIASNYCTYGNYNEALNYIEKIIQIDPHDVNARELKNTLLRIKNPQIKSYLSSSNKTINEAETYKKAGDRANLVKTLKADNNDYWANFYLAEYCKENGDYHESVEYYQKSIQLKPNYSQSYLGLAQAYMSLNEFQNAINNLDKYLTYNKYSDTAYALKAISEMNLNYLPEALNDIKKALNIEENLTYFLIEAKILYHEGDYDEAREKLILLSRNIQTSEVYKYLGLCDYAQNDFKNALLNFDKAIILSNEDKELITIYNSVKIKLDNK